MTDRSSATTDATNSQLTYGDGDVPQGKRDPIAMLTVALLLNGAFLTWFCWYGYEDYRVRPARTKQELRIKELCGIILHLDEVLTMSARMAAVTGDLRWEDRYRNFEPELDAAIKEAMQLAPDAYGCEAAAKTDQANIRLVEMENAAFDLVRQSRKDQAKEVLFASEYDGQKGVYAKGMADFDASLSRAIGASPKISEGRAVFEARGSRIVGIA